MKRKPVPPVPETVDAIADVQGALPLVPAREEDAVQRLLRRGVARNREAAGEWLEFLVALGLARTTSGGYARERVSPDDVDLADAFVDGVFGAERSLELLSDASRPLDAEAVYERFRPAIPRWERNKRPDWEDVWRERVRRLLDWAVLFDLARSDERGYRRP